MIAPNTMQKMHTDPMPLYPTADLVLRFYTVRSPSGFRECEFHCNRAAVLPLLKVGWTIISERAAQS